MPGKIKLAILFGGQSCEHEVSVTSARSMLAAMNRERYDITLVGIDKTGRWLSSPEPRQIEATLAGGEVTGSNLVPVSLRELTHDTGAPGAESTALSPDVVFPLLHGPFGEDGTMQGLLDIAGVAYVGAGVLGSAVGMDKAMCKQVLKAHGLPQVPWVTLSRARWRNERDTVLDELAAVLPATTFVKPANMGSSVGVSRATDRASLATAIDHAAEFDLKIIVEAAAENCREVECAVLGNEDPQASVVGEIIPADAFYSYSDKYLDGKSEVVIPADLPQAQTQAIREAAVAVFQAVGALGLSRVDFFADRESEAIFVNEINTMPGFTPISMYPKLWEASGLSYPDLVDRLIELAIERHDERSDLRQTL